MIVQEFFEVNGTEWVHTYSDAGRYILRDGLRFEDADDPVSFGRTYTEGKFFDPDDSEVLEILLGGAT